MRSRLLVLATTTTIALAGCGGDDAATTSSAAEAPAAASTAEPTTSAPAAGGGAVTVGMKGLEFVPADVTVKVGTKVTWKNEEEIPHNVTAEEGADFASDTFGKDGTYAFDAKTAGTIKYVCTIHPGMDGTLTVVK